MLDDSFKLRAQSTSFPLALATACAALEPQSFVSEICWAVLSRGRTKINANPNPIEPMASPKTGLEVEGLGLGHLDASTVGQAVESVCAIQPVR